MLALLMLMGERVGIKSGYLEVSKSLEGLFWEAREMKENTEFIRGMLREKCTSRKHLGKYAFIRVLHFQESVSGGFSFLASALALTAAVFVGGARRKLSRLPGGSNSSSPDRALMGGYIALVEYLLLGHSFVWGASCLFHFRDTYLTQCLDYFGALAGILSVGVLSVNRLTGHLLRAGVPALIFFLGHCLYMHFVEFNFTYNSLICGAGFIANTFLWGVWYRRQKGCPERILLKIAICGLGFSSVFQVIDFGPALFLIDSHALWHIYSAGFSGALYLFLYLEIKLGRI